MLTFHTNLSCLKAFHRLDHSIHIVEYHRKKIITPKLSIFTGTRKQDRFWVCDLCSCNLIADTNSFCLGAILLSCLVSKLQKHFHRDSNPGQIFRVCGLYSYNLIAETNNFGLGTVLLSCSVSELQEPASPGLELITLFRRFNLCKISSCSQGVSMPSLVKIGISVLEV
jgi:hypothetical protein